MRQQVITIGVAAVMFGVGTSVGPLFTASAQLMPTTTLTTVPNQRYARGSHSFGPIGIPAGAEHVTIALTRENWPDIGGDVVGVLTEASYDGGNTWTTLVGFTTRGGELRLLNGAIAPVSSVTGTLDALALPPTMRQVRGLVTVERAIDSAITITVQ